MAVVVKLDWALSYSTSKKMFSSHIFRFSSAKIQDSRSYVQLFLEGSAIRCSRPSTLKTNGWNAVKLTSDRNHINKQIVPQAGLSYWPSIQTAFRTHHWGAAGAHGARWCTARGWPAAPRAGATSTQTVNKSGFKFGAKILA